MIGFCMAALLFLERLTHPATLATTIPAPIQTHQGIPADVSCFAYTGAGYSGGTGG